MLSKLPAQLDLELLKDPAYRPKLHKRIASEILAGNPLLKFAYLDEGSQKFIQILDSPDYYTFKREMKIISERGAAMRRRIKRNVVVLGTGDGRKEAELLKSHQNVYLIDISAPLLEISKKHMGDHVHCINACFEDVDYRVFSPDSTIVMLGGSLGNINEFGSFLKKLKDELPGANLILGMEFADVQDPKEYEQLIQEYRNEAGFDFVFQALKELGFERGDGELAVSFDEKQKRILERFQFNEQGRKKAAKSGLGGVSGVLLSISLKMGRWEFQKRLDSLGIRVGAFDFYEGQNHILELLL